MLLSYETSSLAYDDTDLIHGKFYAAHGGVPTTAPVRIFCNVYGVFGDLVGRFAKRYDEYGVPVKLNGIVDYGIILSSVPRDAVKAITEEEGFWAGMQAYPWYMLLMQEVYNLCGGEYFLFISFYDSLQLEDRAIWVWRHFGNVSRERTLILSSNAVPLLIKSRHDILLDANLLHIEKWTQAGGSGFFWPEISSTCKDPANFLSKRTRLFSRAINDLKALDAP